LGYVFQDGQAEVLDSILPLNFEKFTTDQGIWLPEAGVSWMFCPCQTIGVSIYVDGGLVSKFNRPVPGYANAAFDDGKPLELTYYQLVVAPSWAWRINSVHSIGVAVNLAITQLEVEGIGAVAGGVPLIGASFFPNDVTNRGTEYSEGMSFRFGWLGNLCDRLMVGFTFQTKTWVRKYKKYQGLLPDAGWWDLPGSLGVGVTFRPFSCMAISAEYSHVIWNKVTNSFWADGFNFGGVNGRGISWNAQGIFKVGAYWQLAPCLTLRAGYNWGQAPVSVVDTVANVATLPTVEHHVTAGATYAFDCNEISFYYYYGFRHRINGRLPWPAITNGYNIENEQQSLGVAYGRRF
jgi:long-chain fatty acid transport protein